MTVAEITPDHILDFLFPDGPNPEPEAHLNHWIWRMRGGAHQAVIDGYSDLTKSAVLGASRRHRKWNIWRPGCSASDGFEESGKRRGVARVVFWDRRGAGRCAS